MKKVFSKWLSVIMVLTLLLTLEVSALASSEEPEQRTVIDAFLSPNAEEKPMCRMWFPDAWAGVDEYDTIEKQINALAEAGFGGVEIAYLADGSSYSNTDAAMYGWGTEAWRETLKKVLRAANAVEGGFTVDITFTAHWPLCINTIDPNDDAASSYLTGSVTKVSGTDVTLELPAGIKTSDAMGNPFIFVDKLTSVSLAPVTSVEGSNVFVDLDAIIDATALFLPVEEGGWPAGVPDEATFNEKAEEYGWNGTYESAVVSVFGEAPESFDPNDPENISPKMDSEFRRVRMADYQYQYVANLSSVLGNYTASEGDELAVGDYVAIASFYRGTGQVFSDGGFGGWSESMVNNLYVPDYINEDGIRVITDYWDEYILDDELLELMEENAKNGESMLFEDSLELTGGTLWTAGIAEDIENAFGTDYPYAAELMAVMALSNVGGGSVQSLGASGEASGSGVATDKTDTSVSVESADSALASQLRGDYNLLRSWLYSTEHYGAVSRWSREQCAGYGFRVQIEADICAPVQENIDVIEGDNGSKGDGLRMRTAYKNIMGKDLLSMEAVTGMQNLSLSWEDVLIEVSQNFSQGVNHVILHGTPYSKSLNGYNAQWPGWSAFGDSFADSYTYRQAWWDDAPILTGYMARNQAVLQQGVEKKDLAVFGSGWTTILQNGWTYDIVSDALLVNADNAVVTEVDGQPVLYADGPAYKAIVLSGVNTLTAGCLEKLISYAEAGLPIYIIDSNASSVSGTEKGENTVANVAELFATLEGYDSVKEVADKDEGLLAALAADEIVPGASYDNVPNLVSGRYEDTATGSQYYYLYNDYNTNGNNNMLSAGIGKSLKSGEALSTVVTLTGEGVPYMLDAMTGEITPIAEYTDNGDGRISMEITLEARESVLIGLVRENDSRLYAPVLYALCDGDSATRVAYDDGRLVLYTDRAGQYTISLSDGSVKTVTVGAAGETLPLNNDWSLTIESYGPDYRPENVQKTVVSDIDGVERPVYYDPSATLITEISFDGIDLTDEGSLWANLSVDSAALSVLGVSSMGQVSGIGLYEKTFSLNAWDGMQGAILWLSYGQQEITTVTVNGTVIPFNSLTDRIDIGAYLHTGENTIAIRTATTLLNRAIAESEAFAGTQKHAGAPVSAQTYGVTGAEISFYTKTGIS